MDARRQRRLSCEVLDHDPTEADILCFLARPNDQITDRGHQVAAITTDGSPWYPKPIAVLFGGIPHQVCEFHIKNGLAKAVLRALARLRKRLAAEAPDLPRGRCRNTSQARRLHQQARAAQRRVSGLFGHRHLFVRNHLTASERLTLGRLVRGQFLLRALRAIMDEVYRLFDWR